jgi:hypothetical protein
MSTQSPVNDDVAIFNNNLVAARHYDGFPMTALKFERTTPQFTLLKAEVGGSSFE